MSNRSAKKNDESIGICYACRQYSRYLKIIHYMHLQLPYLLAHSTVISFILPTVSDFWTAWLNSSWNCVITCQYEIDKVIGQHYLRLWKCLTPNGSCFPLKIWQQLSPPKVSKVINKDRKKYGNAVCYLMSVFEVRLQ